jgi:hypothetical protein
MRKVFYYYTDNMCNLPLGMFNQRFFIGCVKKTISQEVFSYEIGSKDEQTLNLTVNSDKAKIRIKEIEGKRTFILKERKKRLEQKENKKNNKVLIDFHRNQLKFRSDRIKLNEKQTALEKTDEFFFSGKKKENFEKNLINKTIVLKKKSEEIRINNCKFSLLQLYKNDEMKNSYKQLLEMGNYYGSIDFRISRDYKNSMQFFVNLTEKKIKKFVENIGDNLKDLIISYDLLKNYEKALIHIYEYRYNIINIFSLNEFGLKKFACGFSENDQINVTIFTDFLDYDNMMNKISVLKRFKKFYFLPSKVLGYFLGLRIYQTYTKKRKQNKLHFNKRLERKLLKKKKKIKKLKIKLIKDLVVIKKVLSWFATVNYNLMNDMEDFLDIIENYILLGWYLEENFLSIIFKNSVKMISILLNNSLKILRLKLYKWKEEEFYVKWVLLKIRKLKVFELNNYNILNMLQKNLKKIYIHKNIYFLDLLNLKLDLFLLELRALNFFVRFFINNDYLSWLLTSNEVSLNEIKFNRLLFIINDFKLEFSLEHILWENIFKVKTENLTSLIIKLEEEKIYGNFTRYLDNEMEMISFLVRENGNKSNLYNLMQQVQIKYFNVMSIALGKIDLRK